MQTEIIKSLTIPCISDTLFKIILKESPKFRNKLIALILDLDINIVNQYIVTDSIVNVINSDQKQAQVDFLLKNGKKYIDLEAYTSYKVSNIIKNYHYACGIFWRANKKGKVYDTNTEIIQIVFNNFNDIGRDIINIEYLPITYAKGFDKKLITIINVNLALLEV